MHSCDCIMRIDNGRTSPEKISNVVNTVRYNSCSGKRMDRTNRLVELLGFFVTTKCDLKTSLQYPFFLIDIIQKMPSYLCVKIMSA